MLHGKHWYIRSPLGELKRTWFPAPLFVGVALFAGMIALVSTTLIVSVVVISSVVSTFVIPSIGSTTDVPFIISTVVIPFIDSMVAILPIASIISLMSLACPSGSFQGIGRTSLPLGLMIPLYSSFSREGLLVNMNRRLIVSMIKKKEGITFTELKQKLDLQNGVLAYHLSILQKNHFIKSFSDGKFKRFYVKGTKLSGLTSAEEHIMNVIRAHPNISRRSIAERIDCSQGTVNMNLKSLLKKELISVKKVGKHLAYFPRN